MFRGRAWVNLVPCLITLSVALVTFSQTKNEEESPAGNQIDWLTSGSQLEDVIECFNSIRVQNQSEKPSHQQLVFLGDSRIRHLFYNFYEKFPDYDFQWDGVNRRKVTSHNDINVNSIVLNLKISYKWRPFVDDMMNDLHLLTTGPTAPTLVIMGMASWYVVTEQTSKGSLSQFEKSLKNAIPLIRKLSRRSTILWINQLPVSEPFLKWFCPNCLTATIERYNLAAHRILKNTGAVIWDFSAPLGFEYLRSCSLNFRDDAMLFWNCHDGIHTGHVLLGHISQILFKLWCHTFH